MTQRAVKIRLRDGLAARTVALLVQVASQHESTVYMEAEGKKVNAKSIMGMMSLGLDTGAEVVVTADGNDEQKAVDDIERFLSGSQET
ncbi:MAG: HPr family phosphocarrier protein [Clostridium sp.]|nr:HPr family phosphocarrier protein [Clostridium sp.]